MRFIVATLNSFSFKDHSYVKKVLLGTKTFYSIAGWMQNQNALKRFLCLSDPSTPHDAIYIIKGVCALNGNPLLKRFSMTQMIV